MSGKAEDSRLRHDASRKLLTSLIPPDVARRYRVIPWELSGKVLTLALEDPENWNTLDMVRFRTGFDIEPHRKDAREMDELLSHYYPRTKTVLEELSEDFKKESEGLRGLGSEAFRAKPHQLTEIASQAPLVRWVNRVLHEGLKAGASDIHFEALKHTLRVRVRRDGILYEIEKLSAELARPVLARIKVMAGLDIAESRLPQDGRIQVIVGEMAVDLRVSTLPTFSGECAVIRVLDQGGRRRALHELGFSEDLIQKVRHILKKPNGMFLVTGPTGSGKTTTLYACLMELDRKALKVITAEDPVEYEEPCAVQIAVQERIGLGFDRILRSILRHDPDVILVGEIRDEVTAKIALQASLTGHLVLGTLHTNDAPGAIVRLMEMGLEPFLIAASLKGVLAQRLMRKLCSECRIEIQATSPALSPFHELQDPGNRIFEARGCPHCQGFGYCGRVAIGEFFQVGSSLRALIAAGSPLEILRQKALEEGMSPLHEESKEKLLQGVSSLEEYLRFRPRRKGKEEVP